MSKPGDSKAPVALPQGKKVAVDIFSGFCAGIAVTIVGHPFETLKVRLQTQPSGPNQIYSGLWDCIQKTLKWEGPLGFYKGVTAPLAGQLFFRSCLFFTFGEVTRQMSRRTGRTRLTPYDHAIGGSAAWFVSTFIECPLQLASSQMQVEIVRQKSVPGYVARYSGVFDFWQKTLRERGVAGLYQGIAPHLVRNVVGGAFHFGVFEALRQQFAKRRGVPVSQVTFWENMVAGATGGFVFWSVIYPVDVVKSAIQADSTNPAERKYRGFADTVRKLYAEGGWRRFTRGFSACTLRALPANAALLTTATVVREWGYRMIAPAADARQ